MKNLLHFFMTFILALTLTVSAPAGEIPTAGIAALPSPSANGEMSEPGIAVTDLATQVMLAIVESIVSIF